MQDCCPERLTPPLSGGHPPAPGPRAVLGLSLDATRAEAQRAFRRLAKQTHPDAGGDAAAFRAVAGAWADLVAVLPAESDSESFSVGDRRPVVQSRERRAYQAVAAPGGRVVWAERRPPVRRAAVRPDFAAVLAEEVARRAA